MITIDENRSKDASPDLLSDLLKDPWEDWKPSWTGKKSTPQDVQEQHSPTEQVSVRLTAER